MCDRHVNRRWVQGAILASASLLLGWGASQDVLAETHQIEMKDRRFSMETMTIKVGESVRWANGDREAHQVVSGDGLEDPLLGTPMNADLVEPGQDYTHTFATPGRYPYMCFIHWARATISGKVAMSGVIVVEP